MACATEEGVRFVIPSLPPSVNSLYQIIYHRKQVELRPEARRWKSDSKAYIPRFTIADASMLRIDFVFHYPFYAANGNLRVFDSPNLLKLAVDCICERLEIKDQRVKCGSWSSVDEQKQYVEVKLSEVRNAK